MKITVCFQVIPDLSAAAQKDLPATPDQEVSGLHQRVLDTYDESALELALRLRDQDSSVELTAVTVSDRDDKRIYESLYALGFSRVIRIACTVAPFSPKTKAALLAAQAADADLILAGRQSGLSGSQMTPRYLAEALQIPFVDNVCKLAPAETGVRFQAIGGGKISEGILVSPAVALVSDGGWLRIPTLRARMAVKSMQCQAIAAELQQSAEIRPIALHRPPAREACRWIEGTPAVQASEILRLLKSAQDTRESNDQRSQLMRLTYGGALIAEFSEPQTEPPQMSAPNDAWVQDYSEQADDSITGLSDADLVYLAGRGIGGAEERGALQEAAKHTGAQIGATRAAVLAGWYPIGLQVGISGLQLNSRAALVLGASGAAAFTAGLERCGMLIAVNNDAEAPIFRRADYGVLASCSDILQALNAAAQSPNE